MNHTKINIFYKLQYDNRSKWSCETQMIGFVSDIANNMDQGKPTDTLIMNFRQAFGKVGLEVL